MGPEPVALQGVSGGSQVAQGWLASVPWPGREPWPVPPGTITGAGFAKAPWHVSPGKQHCPSERQDLGRCRSPGWSHPTPLPRSQLAPSSLLPNRGTGEGCCCSPAALERHQLRKGCSVPLSSARCLGRGSSPLGGSPRGIALEQGWIWPTSRRSTLARSAQC